MMGHNLCFKGVIWKIIPKLTLSSLLNWGTVISAIFAIRDNFKDFLGPVVQSIVSLTSSLRGQLSGPSCSKHC